MHNQRMNCVFIEIIVNDILNGHSKLSLKLSLSKLSFKLSLSKLSIN